MVEEDATIVERRVDCVLTREDCRRASSSSDIGIFLYLCDVSQMLLLICNAERLERDREAARSDTVVASARHCGSIFSVSGGVSSAQCAVDEESKSVRTPTWSPKG